jgi:translation initiation factor RLI1
MHQLLPHLKTELNILLTPGWPVVLTGENGIGKSTFLHYFQEKNGGIFCDQKALDIFFDRKISSFREILLDSSSVMDKLFFDRFWKASGLSDKEDRNLSQLSGGEFQLLKLISICSAEGDVYLLDEPGQYLDREKKKLLGQMVNSLVEKKKSLLIVEHDCSWLPAGVMVKELTVDQNVLKEKSAWTT